MGKLSRTKGCAFERKIAARLRKQWPDATVRRTLQAHRAYESDIVVEGDAPAMVRLIWWELTDSVRPNPVAKYDQAMTDLVTMSRSRRAVVVWHKSRSHAIMATLEFDDLEFFARGYGSLTAKTNGTLVTLDFEDFLRLLS